MLNIQVALVTLGCAKNLVDSEIILGQLRENGYIPTGKTDEADVIIINTCGFIESAREESIGKILEMARMKEGNCRLLIAAGCMAQRYGADLLSELPELDGLLGVNDIGGVAEAIRRGLQGERVVLNQGECRASENAPRLRAAAAHSAYLKIAEGCDNRCTYCAIPAIRGPYRSREIRAIIREAEKLAAEGAKELNLIAQDITCYGTDLYGSRKLPELLQSLSKISGVSWIRLLYAYPERVDNQLIECIARTEKICKYLDLPIQHGSDKILRKMGRKMPAEKILELLSELRRQIPGIVLRSSFIVGFPDEKEEDYKQLLAFLHEAQLDYAVFFAYSREEGTKAARFGNQVPVYKKEERIKEAVAAQSAIVRLKQQALVGSRLTALADGRSALDQTIWLARAYRQAPEVDGYIRLKNANLKSGDMVPVAITGFDGYDLLARVVGSES